MRCFGGAVASALGLGPVAAAHAMAVMAVASVVVSLALTPGLRRSRPGVVTGMARATTDATPATQSTRPPT